MLNKIKQFTMSLDLDKNVGEKHEITLLLFFIQSVSTLIFLFEITWQQH